MNEHLWTQWLRTFFALFIAGIIANVITAPLFYYSSFLSYAFMNEQNAHSKEMVLILIVGAIIGLLTQLIFSGIGTALITYSDRRWNYTPFFKYRRLFSSLFLATWATTVVISVISYSIVDFGLVGRMIFASIFASFSGSTLGIFMGLYLARVKK